MPLIDSVVSRAAYAAPDRIAVREWESGRAFTYFDLDAAISALAAWLKAHGLNSGDAVAIHLPNSFEFLVAQFASFRFGGVAAYINFRLAPAEAARQMKLARVRAIVTTKEKARIFREDPDFRDVPIIQKDGAGSAGVAIDDIISAGGRIDFDGSGGEDRDAIARFTSGSTGSPKGVLVTHRAWLIRAVSMLSEEMQIIPFSSTLVLGPLTHQAGLFVIPTFLRRGTMVLLEDFDVEKVGAVLSSGRISCTQMVPTIMHLVLETPSARKAFQNSGLDRLIYGGSPVRQTVLEEALQLLPTTEFIQGYGSHEAGAISYLDGAAHRDPVLRHSAGRPFLAAEIRIRKAAPEDLGEIEVKAPWLPHARLTEAGREPITDQWAATGDLGEMKDGFLFLRDRLNDVIISGGFNIYPMEIEKVLNLHPDILGAAVVSAPDDRWGERVIAFVVPRDAGAFSEQNLRDHCRGSLANYKVPKEFHAIAEIPLNANGKPDRRRLSQTMWAGQERRIN